MNLFTLLGTIAINNEQANRALDETASKAGQTSQKTQTAFGKIGAAAGVIGKAVVTAGGCVEP